MKGKRLVAAAILAAATIANAAAAENIDTTTGNSYAYAPFGEPLTATYGQTFTVGADPVLNSFSLFLVGSVEDTPPVDFQGYLYAWDGEKATGPALYASGLRSYAGSVDPQELSFPTGGLALASGQQYVAFLSTSGLQDGRNAQTQMPGGAEVYVGGDFFYSNNGDDFGQLTSQPWSTNGGDAWFRASFSAAPVSGVPEPGTWAMLLLGFGAVGTVLRSRRGGTTSSLVAS